MKRFLGCPARQIQDARVESDGTLAARTTGDDAYWVLKDTGLCNQYVRLTMKVRPVESACQRTYRCRLHFRTEAMKGFNEAHVLTHWIKNFEDFCTYTFKCIPFQREKIVALRLDPINCPAEVTIRDFEIVDYGSANPAEPAEPEAAAEDALRMILLSYYSRTGSTLAMKILTRHPQITGHTGGTHDANILKYFAKLYFMFITSHIPSGPKRDERFIDRFRRFSMHYQPEYALTKPVEFDQYVHIDAFRQHYGRFLRGYLPELLADMGAPNLDTAKYYVEKQMDSGRFFRALLELFPQARIIAAFRDPRDVLASLLAFQKKERIVKKKGQTPADMADEIMTTYAARIGFVDEDPARGMLYRYEDLLARPGETIRQIVEFLALDSSDEIIDAMAGVVTGGDLQAARHMTAGSVEQTVGRWANELDAKCLQRFAEHGEVFGRLGYEI